MMPIESETIERPLNQLVPLGDRGFFARFDTEDQAAGWAATLCAQAWAGIVDVVPAYNTVGVFADPAIVDFDDLETRLRHLVPSIDAQVRGTLISLPVLYDGEDLEAVAQRLGLTSDEVIAAHSGQEFRVFAIGFLPGFPYAGYLPDALRGLPRRPSPRTRVPAGSVAIVGKQTGVYPSESPGGWHLLGRTPLRIVDLARGHFPIRAGDRLRFVPIGPEEFAARREELL
jgi:KipI family sensor histidine kinase inhibitor